MVFELSDLVERSKIKNPEPENTDYFIRGVEDRRAELGFCKDYENWNVIQQKYYEWGRQYVIVCPKFNIKAYRVLPVGVKISIANRMEQEMLRDKQVEK